MWLDEEHEGDKESLDAKHTSVKMKEICTMWANNGEKIWKMYR